MKSLVEELREVEYKTDDCSLTSLYEFATGSNDCKNHSCYKCPSLIANALADRIEREYLPKPLFEDGEPVEVGDTFKTKSGRNFEVSDYVVRSDGYTEFFNKKTFVNYLIRTVERVKRQESKDSLERIKKDATKSLTQYWNCEHVDCKYCPSKVDGKTPAERYGTSCCSDAINLDIIERAVKVMESRND